MKLRRRTLKFENAGTRRAQKWLAENAKNDWDDPVEIPVTNSELKQLIADIATAIRELTAEIAYHRPE